MWNSWNILCKNVGISRMMIIWGLVIWSSHPHNDKNDTQQHLRKQQLPSQNLIWWKWLLLQTFKHSSQFFTSKLVYWYLATMLEWVTWVLRSSVNDTGEFPECRAVCSWDSDPVKVLTYFRSHLTSGEWTPNTGNYPTSPYSCNSL